MSRGNGKPRSGSPPSPSRERLDAAVRTLQAGPDGDAERLLFERFRPGLLYLFRRLGESTEDARDLAQDVFFAAFQNIDQFRFESTFATWLRTIAENHWKNAVRHRRTYKRTADADAIALDSVAVEETADASKSAAFSADPPLDPESALLARERREKLAEAIDELAPGQRRCVTLWLGGKLTYRQIAELLNVTESTVKTQIHDAKNRLRPVLAKLFSGVEV